MDSEQNEEEAPISNVAEENQPEENQNVSKNKKRRRRHNRNSQKVNNEKPLVYGSKNVNEAVENISLALAPRTVILPLTTRAIGFVIRNFIATLSRLKEPNINLAPLCNALYRVSLLQLDMKMSGAMQSQCSRNLGGVEYDIVDVPDNFRRVVLGAGAGIAPIANLIRSIGCLKTPSTTYLPRFGVCFPNDPANVRFTNLRAVVLALHSPDTTLEQRDYFYKRNPIPGAVWNDGRPKSRRSENAQVDQWILQNPDDIMPAQYGLTKLREDVDTIANAVDKLGRKYPKFLSYERIDYSGPGLISQLVSSDTIPVRCPSLEANEEGIVRSIIGEYNHFWSMRTMSEPEFFLGVLLLAGECYPTTYSATLSPRRRQTAEVEGSIDYGTVLQVLGS